MNAAPLIVILKSIIERSYEMRPVIHDIGPFLIGDKGYEILYGDGQHERSSGARMMVREEHDSVRLAVYYPDALVRHLERFNPLIGLGDVNIDEFSVLIEELDHLLTLAGRVAEGRPVSLLELEHHANLTKYLVVLHLLGRQIGRTRLPESLRLWARHHLFGKYSGEKSDSAERYREAAGLADRHARLLDGMTVPERRSELCAFHRRSFSDTCRLLTSTN